MHIITSRMTEPQQLFKSLFESFKASFCFSCQQQASPLSSFLKSLSVSQIFTKDPFSEVVIFPRVYKKRKIEFRKLTRICLRKIFLIPFIMEQYLNFYGIKTHNNGSHIFGPQTSFQLNDPQRWAFFKTLMSRVIERKRVNSLKLLDNA